MEAIFHCVRIKTVIFSQVVTQASFVSSYLEVRVFEFSHEAF